jgi:hypothetical protein
MKLQSYVIADALQNRQIETAVRILLDHFGLPQPDVLPKITIIPEQNITRLLVWAGDDFFEWASVTGFDKGSHSYPLDADGSSIKIDNIIAWI